MSRRNLIAVAVAVGAGLPLPALAGSLELIPQVQVGGVYETNPRYLPDCPSPGRCGNEYSTGTFVDARLLGLWRTQDAEVSLAPRVRDWNYLQSNKDLNNNDIYLDAGAEKRFQRLRLGLAGVYNDTLIRQQVFESASPEDPNAPPPDIGGSGRVADDGSTQERWLVRPTLSYQASQRNALSLEYEYQDVTFDEQANIGFFDFDSQSVNVTLTHTLDPRNAVLLSLNGSTFDASNADRAPPLRRFSNQTDTYGISGIYQRAFSETLSGTLQAGTARNTVNVTSPLQGQFRSTQTTLVGNVGLRKRTEKTTFNFDAGRSQVPRSDGRQITQDQVRIFIDRTLTQRLNGQVGVIALDQEGISDLDRFEQTYFAVDLTGSYRIERDWTVQATYSYQQNNTNFRSILNLGQDDFTNEVDQLNRRIFFSVIYRGIGIRR